MLQKEHPVYLETVAFRNIARFTLVQLVYMFAVWGVTWAGAIGIAFPFLIVLLIPARQYVMPKVRCDEAPGSLHPLPAPRSAASTAHPFACGVLQWPLRRIELVGGIRMVYDLYAGGGNGHHVRCTRVYP